MVDQKEHEGMSTETASNATSGIVRWRQCSEYYFVLQICSAGIVSERRVKADGNRSFNLSGNTLHSQRRE